MLSGLLNFSLPREDELQDGGLDGAIDNRRNAIQSTDHAQVVPVHLGDERADPAALAQHQEMIEERAA